MKAIKITASNAAAIHAARAKFATQYSVAA